MSSCTISSFPVSIWYTEKEADVELTEFGKMSTRPEQEGRGEVKESFEPSPAQCARNEPRMVRLGESMTSKLLHVHARTVDQSATHMTARTGTDLQNTETNVGLSSPRIASISESSDDVVDESHHLQEGSSGQSQELSAPSLHRDPYRFEYFRLLVGLIIYVSCFTIINALVYFNLRVTSIMVVLIILRSAGTGLSAVLIWVIVHVVSHVATSMPTGIVVRKNNHTKTKTGVGRSWIRGLGYFFFLMMLIWASWWDAQGYFAPLIVPGVLKR